MEEAEGRVKGLSPTVLKQVLRSKMNKANIERDETKNHHKEESHRIHPKRVEIFRRLLRYGINKMDSNGVKTQVLIQYYQS